MNKYQIPVIAQNNKQEFVKVFLIKTKDLTLYGKDLGNFLLNNCFTGTVEALFTVFFKWCIAKNITNTKKLHENFMNFYGFMDDEFDKELEKLEKLDE